MKRIHMLYLLIVLISISLHQAAHAQTESEMSMREDHIQLVKRFTDAIINKDFEEMEQLLHENYTGYGPYIEARKNKTQEIAEWRRVWGQSVANAQYNRSQILTVAIEEGEMAGNWVLDYAIVSATYIIRPNKEVTFMYHAAHKIVDNQIAETYNYFNADDVQQQLGI